MGYRVGIQCIQSEKLAYDYALSSVAPVISADGVIYKPEKIGNDWFLNGEKITLSLPECSFSEQFESGAFVAAPIFFIFLLMFCFKTVQRMLVGGAENAD